MSISQQVFKKYLMVGGLSLQPIFINTSVTVRPSYWNLVFSERMAQGSPREWQSKPLEEAPCSLLDSWHQCRCSLSLVLNSSLAEITHVFLLSLQRKQQLFMYLFGNYTFNFCFVFLFIFHTAFWVVTSFANRKSYCVEKHF